MKTQKIEAQIDELKSSYAALPATLVECEAKVLEATKAGDLAGVEAASAELRKVADEFKGKLEAAYTTKPFGERIFIPDLLALQQFARDNGQDEGAFYKKVNLENGRVVALEATDSGITSLKALAVLSKLRTLHLSNNKGLRALTGVPTESLEVIRAGYCLLQGNLSALSNAKGLREVFVDYNESLTSLAGVPTKSLNDISARECGLTGDLSALSSARRLTIVDVGFNILLTTLSGIPTESLMAVFASKCGLRNDEAIRVLTSARKLTTADLSGNPFASKATPIIAYLSNHIPIFHIEV